MSDQSARPGSAEHVRQLLRALLHPGASPAMQEAALQALQRLGPEVLDGAIGEALGEEPSLAELASLLRELEAPDPVPDVTRSSAEVVDELLAEVAADHPAPSPSKGPRPTGQLLDSYDRDLKVLINADFAERPLCYTSPPAADVDPYRRLRAVDSARRVAIQPSIALARLLPHAMTNHGIGFLDLHLRWPGRDDLTGAFIESSLRSAPHRSLPTRLAQPLRSVLADRPRASSLYRGTMGWMERYLENYVNEFYGIEEMQRTLLEVRLEVARRRRAAEVIDSTLIALIELASSVLLIGVASQKDLLRAWQEGDGDARRAAEVYQRYDQDCEMLGEWALRAALRGVPPAWIDELSASDQEALLQARALRRRSDALREHGLFGSLEG